MKKLIIEVPYAVKNCGDGSALPVFFATLKDAEAWEKAQEKKYGEPQWGEPLASIARLEFDDTLTLINPHVEEED